MRELIVVLTTIGIFAGTVYAEPDPVTDWWQEQFGTNEEEEDEDVIISMVGIDLPEFYILDIEDKLIAEFKVGMSDLLKAALLSFMNQQIRTDIRDLDYGGLPMTCPYWQKIIDYDDLEKLKEATVVLYKDRESQEKLYEWARPSLEEAFKKKPATTQALDLFAIWKTQKYLEQYDFAKEQKRAEKSEDCYECGPDFHRTDWNGNSDSAARFYAFWHRRIRHFDEWEEGFSLEDARYWTDKMYQEGLAMAKGKAKRLLEGWQAKYEAGEITDPPESDLPEKIH